MAAAPSSDTEPLRFRRTDLRDFAQVILGKVGVAEKPALTTADLLVAADEREVSTHGLLRLPPYVSRIKQGLVNPKPSLKRLTDKPGFVLIDGDDGLGQLAAARAVEEASRLTRDIGFAVVGVHNSHHLGMCAPYAERLAEQGFIGIIMTNTAPLMAPTGSAKRQLGNNPVAIAVPRNSPAEPVVLDIAFTRVAFGMLYSLQAMGRDVPEGWIHDEDGKWISDPETAILKGIMAPIGGHKGYGLALMVEILSAALTDSNVLDDVGSLFRTPPIPMRVGHLLVTIDPGMLIKRERFLQRVDEVCERVTGAPAIPGQTVLLPGQKEEEARQRSQRRGVPLPANIREKLAVLAEGFGLSLPEPTSKGKLP